MSEEIESTVTGDEIVNQEVDEIVNQETIETPKLSARDAIFANREGQLLEEVEEAKEEKTELPVIEQANPDKVKVKIDGVEEERSIDDLIRSYQKSEAGDRRLQLAAQELKRVEDERLRLDQERQQFEQERQQRPIESKEPDATLEDLKLLRREALEIGDYDEFDRLDEEVNSYRISKSKPQYDEKQIITAAKEQALTQIQYESALEAFKNENKLLFQDNVLYNITMSTFNNMCQESSTYQEAFDKTGRLVKEWIGSVAPDKQGVSAMTDRVERKQSIPDEPGRLNAKSTPPPAKKEETASDIITNMRKARGLPV